MATSIHDLVAALEHEISCPICFEDFEEPKCLPNCAHNICQHCLEGMVKKTINTIECPVCRVESIIPKGGVAAFPKNHLLVRLIEQAPGRKQKQSLKQAVKNCNGKLEDTKSALKEMENRYVTTTKQDEETKQKIQSLAENVVTMVREQERKMLDEMKSKHNRNRGTLESLKSSAAELCENASGCIQTVQDVIENGELMDLKNLKDALVEQMNDFSKSLEKRKLEANREFTQLCEVSLTGTGSVEKFIEDECSLGKLNMNTGAALTSQDIPTATVLSDCNLGKATLVSPSGKDEFSLSNLAINNGQASALQDISTPAVMSDWGEATSVTAIGGYGSPSDWGCDDWGEATSVTPRGGDGSPSDWGRDDWGEATSVTPRGGDGSPSDWGCNDWGEAMSVTPRGRDGSPADWGCDDWGEATSVTPRGGDGSPSDWGCDDWGEATSVTPRGGDGSPSDWGHKDWGCNDWGESTSVTPRGGYGLPSDWGCSDWGEATTCTSATPRDKDYSSCGSLIQTIDSFSCEIAQFNPFSVAASRHSGNFVVLDEELKRVHIFNEEGEVLHTFRIKYGDLWDIAISNEDEIVVVNRESNRLLHYDMNGTFERKFVTAPEEGVKFTSLSVDLHGRFIISSYNNETEDDIMPCILVYSPSGNLTMSFGDGELSSPRKAVFLNGKFYVTNFDPGQVVVFDKNGDFLQTFGDYELHSPHGIAADYSNGNLVVSDPGNSTVQIYSQAGEQLHCFGTDNNPVQVAFTKNYKNLLISCGYSYIQMLTYNS